MKISLTLNGEPAELDVAADEMLLDALRRTGLRGVRATCGIGVCGACTVLVDGEPISGCLYLAAQAEGRAVTTVEGLGGEDPVQRAFEETHAFQCGWCTPGMILTVKALLDEEPKPGEQRIAAALGGNLCRCGCYVEIAEAVRRGLEVS
jgi:aerobic-type carbon monoxide dehydrogenase small subunit (CoxS/CutS family)